MYTAAEYVTRVENALKRADKNNDNDGREDICLRVFDFFHHAFLAMEKTDLLNDYEKNQINLIMFDVASRRSAACGNERDPMHDFIRETMVSWIEMHKPQRDQNNGDA